MPDTSDRQNRIARWLFAIGSLSCLSLVFYLETHAQGPTELEAILPRDAIEADSVGPALHDDPVVPLAGAPLRAARFVSRPESSDDPTLAEEPKRSGERARYLAFLELARRDPKEFERTLATLLANAEAAKSEKIAALRADFASRLDRSHEHLRVYLGRSADPTLRRLAIKLLVEAAPSDAQARDALAGFVRRRPRHLGQRSAALFAILAHGSDMEVARLIPFVYSERDPGVVAGAALALAKNPRPSSRAILEDLRATHPLAEARQRLAKLEAVGWRADETEDR